MSDITVIDIETSGELPWTGELVAVGVGDTVHRPKEGMRAVKKVLSNPKSVVVCHTNYDLRWLLLNGAEMADGVQFHDTKVMAYMLDALQELGLDPLAQRYLGMPKLNKPIRQVAGRIMFQCSLGLVPIEDVPWDEMEEYNGQDIKVTEELYHQLKTQLQMAGQWQFFLEEEAPFSKLLVEMEVMGLPMDRPELEKFHAGATQERDMLGEKIAAETGVVGFNLKSGDQVAAYLYDEMPTFKVQIEVPLLKELQPSVSKGKCKKCGSEVLPDVYAEDGLRVTAWKHVDDTLEPCLGRANMREEVILAMLPDGIQVDKIGNKYVYGWQTVDGRGLLPPKIKKRKKDGKIPHRPPIDAENLSIMYGSDPWVGPYLRWKGLNTLCTNYLDQWLAVEHNGRIHGRFDQARAETGRIVSRDPNLQAIPVSMEWNVRTLFKAPLIIGDYSGLDARVAASMSEDPLMLEIFRTEQDLYGVLAANAWGGPADKTNENRTLMKILFLSVQYSAAAGSLGDKIRVSGQPDKAKLAPQLLRNLEETLPRLFQWKEECLAEARALGYISTMAGRRRYLPDLFAREWSLHARAERQVVASKVQGTSADLVRRCMLKVRERFPHSVCRMILQVHDEVLWQRGPEWDDSLLPELQHIMETAHDFELNVPMKFPVALGDSWDEKDAQGARAYRMSMVGGA